MVDDAQDKNLHHTHYAALTATFASAHASKVLSCRTGDGGRCTGQEVGVPGVQLHEEREAQAGC